MYESGIKIVKQSCVIMTDYKKGLNSIVKVHVQLLVQVKQRQVSASLSYISYSSLEEQKVAMNV